jgi:hypothetical protein
MHAHRSSVAHAAWLSLLVLFSADKSEAQAVSPPVQGAQATGQGGAAQPAATGATGGELLAQANQAPAQKPDGTPYGSDSVVTGGLSSQGTDATHSAQPPEAVPVAATAVEQTSGPEGTPATQLDVQYVQEELAGVRTDLENFKFQWQRERDLHTAITTRYLVINGVVQTRFGFQDNAVNATTPNVVFNRKTTFDVPTALLSFNGILYRDYENGKNLTYSIRYGVSQQATGNSSFLNLIDAQIAYNFLPTVNPETNRLSLTVGQQLLPFGIEVPATEELRPVIRNAQFTLPGGYGLARREVGAILRGELFQYVDYGYNYRVPIVQYALGVVNGNGPNALDDNNFKDVVGRVAFTIPSSYNSWLRQLSIGGTVYYGRQNLAITDAAKVSRPLHRKGDKIRYGLDVYYNHWPLGFTYEYIRGVDDIATGNTLTNAKIAQKDSESHTVTAFYSFGQQFVAGFRNQGRFDDWWPKTYQPFVRYDRFDPNLDKKKVKDVTEIYTAGLNIFFAETTKAQFNYNLRNVRALSDQWSHEALAQFQFGF